MPTLSFRDQLKTEFWEYRSAYCQNSYNEEQIPKKIETKNNQSITLNTLQSPSSLTGSVTSPAMALCYVLIFD